MTVASKSAQDIRNRELAQIHIARSQLGMDEETYHAVLWTVARVKSSKDLDWSGRKRVLDHMKSCGFKVRPKKLAIPHKPLALTKEQIEAKIAVQLKSMGKEWSYAHGISRRIFPQISSFEFLTAEHLGTISSALERTIRFAKQKAG